MLYAEWAHMLVFMSSNMVNSIENKLCAHFRIPESRNFRSTESDLLAFMIDTLSFSGTPCRDSTTKLAKVAAHEKRSECRNVGQNSKTCPQVGQEH